VPDLQVESSYRLDDNLTIFAAELTAIKLAIHWATYSNSVDVRHIAIFSDSLSSIQALETGQSVSRPNLVKEIAELMTPVHDRLTLVWIPSHIGIIGNEIVDKLAGRAIANNTVELTVKHELKEAYQLVEKHTLSEWQNLWDNSTTGRHYWQIESKVSRTIKWSSTNRSKEVSVSRLRFGKCRLNACLHKMRKHPDGMCQLCHQPETVEHFLTKCQNDIARALRNKCKEIKADCTTANVLQDTRLIEIICEKLQRAI
jgi:ribonuclease HI